MDTETVLFAVVQQQDADAATEALNRAGLRVTRVSSVGGFLEMGNVTLLMGLGRDDVPRAVRLLAEHCHQRTAFVDAGIQATDLRAASLIAPIEAQVGGAVIFTFPVERHIRLGTHYAITDTQHDAKEANAMKLIMAIVPEEISSRLLSALADLGYRTTLISTTGGFRRRGNATLLIGIESERVDGVVEKIRGICNGVNATDSCATIFVLGVEKYVRV